MIETFKYDLQLFAEDSEDSTTTTETAEQDTQEEAKEPIPEELAGISEETAREVMEQAKEEAKADTPEKETVNDVQDTDTKPVDTTFDEVKQKVPYERFKQEVDKRHAMEDELAQYRQRFGGLNAGNQPTQNVQPTQPTPQAQMPPQSEPSITPQINLSDEVVQEINKAAVQGALQMTGMSQDDVDAMEYMDDDDPRRQRYDLALNMAKSNIMDGIKQMQRARADKARQILALHAQSVNDYNSFAQKEMSAPDFEQVKDFATNDYFEQLPDTKKRVISAAYYRIERNVASPAEIELIQDYYGKAKNAYHAKHPQTVKQNADPRKKIQQAQSMPRAEQVSGTTGVDETITSESLQRMLETTPWDNIPKKYQDILLGIG